MPIGFN